MGAAAVQVGTASFVRPRAALDVLEEMTRWLAARGMRSLESWRGGLAAGTVPSAGAPWEGRE